MNPRGNRWAFWIVLVVMLFPGVYSYSDTVWTVDGSIIQGKVERLVDGKLKVNTDIAGAIQIDMAKVKAIETTTPLNVILSSGDQLVGEILEAPAAVNTAMGKVPIAVDQITQIWPQGEENPEILKVQPKWSASLEAGAQRADGNTDTLNAHAQFKIRRTWSQELLELFLAGNYSETDSKRSKNEIRGGAYYENSFYAPWFFYLRQLFEYDEFQNLDLRSTTSAGIGYQWIKEANQELKTRVGLGYRYEAFDSGDNEDDAILDAGWDYWLNIRDWTQFTHNGTISPSLSDFGDYRLNLDTALLFPLANPAWRWKIGMRNDYNAEPQEDLKKWGNLYYTSILFNW